MALNTSKDYMFTPTMTGAVQLSTRSSRKSRLWAGGSFWKSLHKGTGQNSIRVACIQDTSGSTPEGVLVVLNENLFRAENIAQNFSAQISLFAVKLQWNEELYITKENNALTAQIRGIRWQISGGETVKSTIEVKVNQVTSIEGTRFMVQTPVADWPTDGTIIIRQRVHRYRLVVAGSTRPASLSSTVLWDIQALRGALNESDDWVRMPVRPQVEVQTTTSTGADGSSTSSEVIVHHTDGAHEDAADAGKEDDFGLTAFDFTYMSGGDGLPANPSNINTGPDRALVHLNYDEDDAGNVTLLNQIYEWKGDSAIQGEWVKYA